MAADAAVMGIRAIDPDSEIAILTEERFPPYRRPALSKSLWQPEVSVESIWLETPTEGVTLLTSERAVALHIGSKSVRTRSQKEIGYDKLLIATGCSPAKELAWDERTLYYRGLDDYLRLRDWTEYRRRFAVIGGGYVGSEIAAALTMHGKEVVMFFPEAGICGRILPEDLSLHLNDYYRARGVQVFPSGFVENVLPSEEGFTIVCADGPVWGVDAVVAGLGARPNDRLAVDAGLQVGNGIWADECLQTSSEDIYAAGDVAAWFHPILQQRIRVEHEDNAIATGYYAGMNMAGERTECEHIPAFYSHLFDLRYDAVGELDSTLITHIEWEEPLVRGTIYYLRDEYVQGVLLWNLPDRLNEAREQLMRPL